MLRNISDLQGYDIRATDGIIGHVSDFYFDDEAWVIRYLVVDTGSWLSSRKVLISPIAVGHPDPTAKALPVSVTKEQVKNSPDIDTEKPVSRQHEIRYLGYYGYPYYWGGAGLWGGGVYPNMLVPAYGGFVATPSSAQSEGEQSFARAEAARHQNDDPHLRDCKTVMRYHLQATDGDIGHVDGFIFDEETWAIRYLIVNTSNWWLGHQVLIAPQWISAVSWHGATVSVNLTRQAVKDAPPYDRAAQLDRALEVDLYKHYARTGYWMVEEKAEPALAGH